MDEYVYMYKIIVIGRIGTGKSNLVLRFTQHSTPSKQQLGLVCLKRNFISMESKFFVLSTHNIYKLDSDTLNFSFFDYLGSGYSISFGYYDEGNCVYHNGTTVVSAQDKKFAFPAVTNNLVEYTIGVHFDSKLLRISFIKDGYIFTNGLDINDMIEKRYPAFMTGGLIVKGIEILTILNGQL